jgi:phage FluMu gp28-like protein
MLKTKLTSWEKEATETKLGMFNPTNDEDLAKLKEDPALFAYYMFRNEKDEPFKAFPYQDLILNDKNRYVLLCCSRQLGKSVTAAIKAIHSCFFNRNYTVVVISKTRDQSIEFIRRIKILMRTCKIIDWNAVQPKAVEAKSEINIRNAKRKGMRDTYSRIISVPATDAARGYTANEVIVDEIAFWENADYIFNEVVEPMTQFTKGKIMMLSTPKNKIGVFWTCYNSDSWSRYQFDWKVNPNNTEEEMEEKRKRLTKMQFDSEYNALFVSNQNSYFSAEDVRKSVNPTLVMGRMFDRDNLVVGVDFGKIHDNAVIIIGKITNSTDDPFDHVLQVTDLRVKPLGTDYASIVSELISINEQFKPVQFVLDATGVGEAPAEALSLRGLPVQEIKFTLKSKIDVLSNLKLLLEQQRIKIPDDLELRNQLELYEYKYTSSNNMVLSAPEGGHDDYVIALALMAFGLSKGTVGTVSMDFVQYSTEEKECRHFYKETDGLLECNKCGDVA